MIFTNQGYTGPYLALVMPRIQSICEALDVPLHVFAAVVNDYNRKPEPGMWYNFVEHANANVQPGQSCPLTREHEAHAFVAQTFSLPFSSATRPVARATILRPIVVSAVARPFDANLLLIHCAVCRAMQTLPGE